MNDKTKYEVLSRLIVGETPKDIVEDFDVPLPTIHRWNRELKQAQEEGNIDKLMQLDQVVVQELVDSAAANAPEVVRDGLVESAGELAKGIDGLNRLSLDFQRSAQLINNKLRMMVSTCDHVSELDTLTDSLVKLQTAFFNKNVTQVNVQNNYSDGSGDTKYGAFLKDVPGDVNLQRG